MIKMPIIITLEVILFLWLGLAFIHKRKTEVKRGMVIAFYDFLWTCTAIFGIFLTISNSGTLLWNLKIFEADTSYIKSQTILSTIDIEKLIELNCPAYSAKAMASQECANVRLLGKSHDISLNDQKSSELACKKFLNSEFSRQKPPGKIKQGENYCQLLELIGQETDAEICAATRCKADDSNFKFRMELEALSDTDVTPTNNLNTFRNIRNEEGQIANREVHDALIFINPIVAYFITYFIAPILGIRLSKSIFELLDRRNKYKKYSSRIVKVLSCLKVYSEIAVINSESVTPS